MKLLYTDIRTSLTEILTREAEELIAAGKRVFYIAPNSLSFEKERAVLECLSQQASFGDYRHALCADGSLPDFE